MTEGEREISRESSHLASFHTFLGREYAKRTELAVTVLLVLGAAVVALRIFFAVTDARPW